MATRHEAREQAFILIFEKSFQTDSDISELAGYAEENDIFVPDEYAVNLTKMTYEKLEEIDPIIERNLKGWSMSRISKITIALLRIAVCEILFVSDVPTGAAINEAVELAKKYAAESEPAYINGVLGSIAKEL